MIVKELNVVEAKELLQDDSVTFIDVRDALSFMTGHAEESINLTSEQLENFVINSDKRTPVLIICYHGISSLKVGQLLINRQFENVYSVIGGYEEWEKDA